MSIFAQKILEIDIRKPLTKKNKIEFFSFKDTNAIYEYVEKYRNERLKNGFWNDKYAISQPKKDTFVLQIDTNLPTKWNELKVGNLPNFIVQNINFQEKKWKNKDFNWIDWENLSQKILNTAQNNGFPFAEVKLDSLVYQENKIEAQIDYQPNKAFFFDTLKIIGDIKTESWFLMRWLGIKEGQPYNHQKILQINRRLKELPFLTLKKNPIVSFRENISTISLELEKKNANRFDGIIGILPNEERQGQVLLTGDLNINLKNLGSRGISFKGRWQRLQTNAQWIELFYQHPLIFRKNFDLELSLQSVRQDSSFVNLDLQASVIYRLPNRAKLSLGIQNRRSSLGEANIFRNVNQLPTIADGQYTSYQLGYEWVDLDNLFYPKQGQQIKISGQWGFKNIAKNPFWADSLYANVPLRSSQWIVKAEYLHYFSIQNRGTLLFKTSLASLNNNFLVLNDLFRVGGLQTLRGHNENIFFATNYVLATLEYRYFFESESYFFLFYDQALLNRKTFQSESSDIPLGAGAGLSFTTQAGIFQVAYALGKSEGQNFAPNRAKIHVGFVARF
jgi:hypothetical protein